VSKRRKTGVLFYEEGTRKAFLEETPKKAPARPAASLDWSERIRVEGWGRRESQKVRDRSSGDGNFRGKKRICREALPSAVNRATEKVRGRRAEREGRK